MNLKSVYIGSLGLFLLWSGCYESRVDRLRLEALAERILKLETWQQRLNDHIRALQVLIHALQHEQYIVALTEEANGYTLMLNDGSVLQIHQGQRGENGQDGAAGAMVMPVIAVRDSSDGHIYWTVEGEVLKNSRGQGVRADGPKGEIGMPGESGEQGAVGIVPQIRIQPETWIWEISVDAGRTWRSTGVRAQGPAGEPGEVGERGPQGPAGKRGDAIFAENGIEVSEEAVVFILADKQHTCIRIPRFQEWALSFPEGMLVEMPINSQRKVLFAITGYGGRPQVEAAGDGGWLAEVVMNPVEGTYLLLNAPAYTGQATVLVILSNGEGKCRVYSLRVNAVEGK